MKKRKYKLVEDDFIIYKGRKLYRIKALRDISEADLVCDIEKGDIGGYVEGYHNLSQEGDCWVTYDSKVYGNAIISKDSGVLHGSKVYGNASIEDTAIVSSSEIYDNVVVKNAADIYCGAEISGNAKVYSRAEIRKKVKIYNNSVICCNILECDEEEKV